MNKTWTSRISNYNTGLSQLIDLLGYNLLILLLELLLIKLIVVEVALMFFWVPVFSTEVVAASALHTEQAHLLLTLPTLGLVLLYVALTTNTIELTCCGFSSFCSSYYGFATSTSFVGAYT